MDKTNDFCFKFKAEITKPETYKLKLFLENVSNEEKDELLSILNYIQAGKFSDSAFCQTLFQFLEEKEGKTIIETFFKIQASVFTQCSVVNVSTTDIVNDEEIIMENTYEHIIQLFVNKVGYFCNENNKTVLHFAARYGWLGIVQSLLEKGADVNVKDEEDKTPLFEATKCRHRDVADLLISSGAEVLCCTNLNHTLLHAASVAGWLDFVQFLLEKGADPNAVDAIGCTPLYAAILQKHRDMVALLIDHGADTTCFTYQGLPVLHCAVIVGNLEIVKCLVEKGADVNDQRIMGMSPLCVACQRVDEINSQKIEIIEYLVDAVNLKNGSAETPLRFIMRYNIDLKLIKIFVERYGYPITFIDEYYAQDIRTPSFKVDIFQHEQTCTQAIVSKFNYKDLPALYNLPLPNGTLPPIENLMIKSPGIIEDIEASVRHEINTSESGHCDLRKPKVIVLRMLAVKSYTNYYIIVLKKKLNRTVQLQPIQRNCRTILQQNAMLKLIGKYLLFK